MVRERVPSPIPFLPEETEEVLRPGRLAVYMTVATLSAIAYWYLGTPGPALNAEYARGFDTAVGHMAWALAFYLAIPLLVMVLARDSVAEAGLRVGDAAYGLKTLVVVSVIIIPVMFLSGGDPLIQGTYPWPGAWAGRSPANLAQWLAIYFPYFVAFEFFFRGFLIRAIRPHWGVGAAIWVQAFAATAVHFGKPLPETLAALPASLLLGLMAVRCRSLIWPVLVHFVVGASTDVFSLYHQGLLFP
jgi:membrane protease YdiL (CAAX protease family)